MSRHMHTQSHDRQGFRPGRCLDTRPRKVMTARASDLVHPRLTSESQQPRGLRGVVVCFWDSDAEVVGSNAGLGFSADRFTTARLASVDHDLCSTVSHPLTTSLPLRGTG